MDTGADARADWAHYMNGGDLLEDLRGDLGGNLGGDLGGDFRIHEGAHYRIL